MSYFFWIIAVKRGYPKKVASHSDACNVIFYLTTLVIINGTHLGAGHSAVVVTAVLLLLLGIGSIIPTGGVTIAVLVMVAAFPAVPVRVKVTLPPLGKVGIANVPACKADTVELTGQAAPPVAVPQVRVLAVKLATTGSLMVAPLAAEGPLLVTTKV